MNVIKTFLLLQFSHSRFSSFFWNAHTSSPTHSFVHAFTPLLTALIHYLINSLFRVHYSYCLWYTRSYSTSFILSLIHLLTHYFIHSFIHVLKKSDRILVKIGQTPTALLRIGRLSILEAWTTVGRRSNYTLTELYSITNWVIRTTLTLARRRVHWALLWVKRCFLQCQLDRKTRGKVVFRGKTC